MTFPTEKIGFLDLENIGSFQHIRCQDYSKLIVFRGALQRTIDIPKQTGDCQIVVKDIAEVGRNNLDFHLTLLVGTLHACEAPDAEFVILSRDKGFDGIAEYLTQNGRECHRVNPVPATTSSKKIISALKKVDADRRPRTVTRLKNHIGAQFGMADEVEQVTQFVEQLVARHVIEVEPNGVIRYCI